MEYNTEYNRQLINSINQFWSDEVRKCTSSKTVLIDIHKNVQKLYNIQQAFQNGERAYARKLAGKLDRYVLDVIPKGIQDYMNSKATTILN